MSQIADAALASDRLRAILLAMAIRAVGEELGLDGPALEPNAMDLNFALLSASALTAENEERAQDAILRVAHAVLRNAETTPDQRAAAMLLLDRVGNRRTVELAMDRFEFAGVNYEELPGIIAADALLRRRELSIAVGGAAPIDVNPFQRQFWNFVHQVDWLSVSAPTSAGKSHIVREWMKSEIASEQPLKLVYLAPTRALVEEVGAHFRESVEPAIGVHTLPWDPDIANYERQIFVLTQERLHLLQERSPQFSPDVIFIDEAQKISEGTRGILLTQVLDEAVLRNSSIRLVFASPLSSNPDVLLEGAGGERTFASIVGETVTVSQNLIYVTQKRYQAATYEFKLVYQGGEHEVGEIKLANAPGGVGQRVPLVAAAVGRLTTGNLVYANGPSDTEKYARLIYEALGPEANLDNDDIQELIDFAKGTVHERFVLADYARRGVAFHYGDMPLVLKAKVEDLFRRGAIRYLVCTSTLLEGVNLPCRNIFMRGPKKGSKHMSMADFWNLAGRAGRWGQEFQGNIFCIDIKDDRAWPEKPGIRARSEIVPAAAATLREIPDMLGYIKAGAPKVGGEATPELESTFSWLSGRLLAHTNLESLNGVVLASDASKELQAAVASVVNEVKVPAGLIKRHAGISPLSMQRMLEAFLDHGHPESLALVPPASDGAKEAYTVALGYIDQFLGGSFFSTDRRLQLAGLIVNWMKGMPLSRIIENRAKWRRERSLEFNYPDLIRRTLKDVEDIARFEAPKYLSCYSDLISEAAAQLGQELENQVIDIEMMLELGVPRRTDMSLIAAGLSRATVRELESYITDPQISPSQAIEWIRLADPEALDVAAFATRELKQVKALLAARLLWADGDTAV